MSEMALMGEMSPEEIKAFEDEQLRLVDRAVAQAKLSKPPVPAPPPRPPITVEHNPCAFWDDGGVVGGSYFGDWQIESA